MASNLYAAVVNKIKDKWHNDKQTFSLYLGGTAIITIALARKYYQYLSRKKRAQQLSHYEDLSTKKNKVILHTFPLWSLGTPNASPACTKMIAYFEYNKIDYILDHIMPTHPHTTKSPWITYKADHIPDSNIIIKYIANNKSLNNINMDYHLNKLQKATLNAYKALIEDCLYFIIIYRRWCIDDNFKVYISLLLEKLPIPLIFQPFIGSQIRKQVVAQAWSQGISRLESKYIYSKGEEIVDCVLEYMRDNKFFFGDKLSSLDLTIYGHIGGMYQVPFTWKDNTNKVLPFRKQINEYMKRVEMECYGELRYWKDIA